MAKVIFLQASVCPQGGVLSPGGMYLVPGGVLSPRGLYLVPGGSGPGGLVWEGWEGLVEGGGGSWGVAPPPPPQFFFHFFSIFL